MELTEVKKIRTYNQETNRVFYAPIHMVNAEWSKTSGFYPQPEPTSLGELPMASLASESNTGVEVENVEVINAEAKPKRSHKKK